LRSLHVSFSARSGFSNSVFATIFLIELNVHKTVFGWGGNAEAQNREGF
jgi:hypothetical protein